jgi:hypothetical protein
MVRACRNAFGVCGPATFQVLRPSHIILRRIYAFVDSVIKADPERSRSRMSLQFDAVDANAFDEASNSVENREALLLARVSTTQTALLKHLGIHDDNQHCIFEKKFGRKFVTRAGLQALETFIRERPEQAINVFGSKAAKQRFSMNNLRAKATGERFSSRPVRHVDAIILNEDMIAALEEPAEVKPVKTGA